MFLSLHFYNVEDEVRQFRQPYIPSIQNKQDRGVHAGVIAQGRVFASQAHELLLVKRHDDMRGLC